MFNSRILGTLLRHFSSPILDMRHSTAKAFISSNCTLYLISDQFVLAKSVHMFVWIFRENFKPENQVEDFRNVQVVDCGMLIISMCNLGNTFSWSKSISLLVPCRLFLSCSNSNLTDTNLSCTDKEQLYEGIWQRVKQNRVFWEAQEQKHGDDGRISKNRVFAPFFVRQRS